MEEEFFPFRPPAHKVPLELEHPWVQSLKELKWHLTQDTCRYAPIIDPPNREYRDTTPPEDRMCCYCRMRWRRLQKERLRKSA